MTEPQERQLFQLPNDEAEYIYMYISLMCTIDALYVNKPTTSSAEEVTLKTTILYQYVNLNTFIIITLIC